MGVKNYTVSEYINLLNGFLENMYAEVTGEVSEMKTSAKGHIYPVIKDKKTGDILPCVMWKSDYDFSGVDLEVGMEIVVKGLPRFYGPFGKISFHANLIELIGEGQLKKAYDKLKAKLNLEGLFDEERKRPIPDFPEKIGVITSLRGEVIHDFGNNLRRSGFKVKIMHTQVEGPEAGKPLTLSVRAFRKQDIDLLVIMRGGGSMQSLAGFDNEILVREVASFPTPVITGVGHHQDVPLVALVADRAESTPSMVASVLSSPWKKAENEVKDNRRIIFDSFETNIKKAKESIWKTLSTSKGLYEKFFHQYQNNKESIGRAKENIHKETQLIEEKIDNERQMIIKTMSKMITLEGYDKLNKVATRVMREYSQSLSVYKDRSKEVVRFIKSNDPERNLKLGYAIVRKGNKIVRTKKDIAVGQKLNIKISDGKIFSEIIKIK